MRLKHEEITEARTANSTNTKAGVSCFVGQESAKFPICVFEISPWYPSKNSLSIAKSISSEKRFINFQALLNDVPPLNTKCCAMGT